jgi:hypothetical protein
MHQKRALRTKLARKYRIIAPLYLHAKEAIIYLPPYDSVLADFAGNLYGIYILV